MKAPKSNAVYVINNAMDLNVNDPNLCYYGCAVLMNITENSIGYSLRINIFNINSNSIE